MLRPRRLTIQKAIAASPQPPTPHTAPLSLFMFPQPGSGAVREPLAVVPYRLAPKPVAEEPHPRRAGSMHVIDRWVGEDSRPAFWSQHYLRRAFARAGAARDLTGLLTWGRVAWLVEQTPCDLLLVRDGAAVRVERPGSIAEARALLADGYTLAFRQPERFDAELASLGRSVALEMGGAINLHLYCTPAGYGSFGWHYDPEEVFIVQTAGCKRYRVRGNTQVAAPLLGGEERGVASRESSPIAEFRLEPGDFLYIPGGHWHTTHADTDSLSISVGVMPPTALDLLAFISADLARDAGWRARLGPLGTGSPRSDHEKLQAVQSMVERLRNELEARATDPSHGLRFLAAWTRASLRSAEFRGPTRVGAP